MRCISNLQIWGLVMKNLSIPFQYYLVFKGGWEEVISLLVCFQNIFTNPVKTFSPNQIYCPHTTLSLPLICQFVSFFSLSLLPSLCCGKVLEAADHEIFLKVPEQLFFCVCVFWPYIKFIPIIYHYGKHTIPNTPKEVEYIQWNRDTKEKKVDYI